MRKIKYILGLVLPLIFVMGCADLETENLNNADVKRVLEDPNEFLGLVRAQYNTAWHNTQHYNSAPAQPATTMADSYTSSWGNFGMRDMSSEPRKALDNTQTYNYAVVFERAYENNYSIIGSMNDILRIYKDDPTVISRDANDNDVTEQVKSEALFLVGMSYGNIGLIYDKAVFVDENIALADVVVEFSTAAEIVDFAIQKFDDAIAAANRAPDFSVNGFNGLSITKTEFIELIRTLQAKYKTYVSRSSVENDANDWATILNYVNAGIKQDFAPIGDGNTWWDGYKYYGTEEGWSRVDMRVVNMLDPAQPSRFPEDGSHPLPESVTGDNRLFSDMQYLVDIPFRANRGLYHYSHYHYIRYGYHYPNATGDMPHTLLSENDLIRAEALIRTGGDKATAASLINNTRVTRGGLTAVSAADTDAVLLQAVMHERYIELFATMGGIAYYDRRRSPDDTGSFAPYTGLQPGTAKEFPIPAKELGLLNEEIYTFGGQ
ncbi:MAG: RagB/SusD family nutrient uptake outer membrane protein [Cyclobacteriaceae bacterium]|nr:RagB/SusD family nutrient uptake outer membrane protein [Cyclobacteriaceae bacterium]